MTTSEQIKNTPTYKSLVERDKVNTTKRMLYGLIINKTSCVLV